MSGIIGTKCGTTRVYKTDTSGGIEQVTVIQIQPNYITMIKDQSQCGYTSLQIASVGAKEKHLSKAQTSVYKKLDIAPQRHVRELRLASDKQLSGYKLGQALGVEVFTETEQVDVTANSKGKGFAGCVKRHGFSMQRATHGNSLSHRAPGSIGQCQFPGRVNPGKKMAGRMGNVRVTVRNLRIVFIDTEKGLLYVSGSVPGPKGCIVYVKSKELVSGEK